MPSRRAFALFLAGPITASLATSSSSAQTDWTNVTPAAGNPAPRYHHAMTFDRSRSVAVLFGGVRPGVGIVADTWEWSAGAWSQIFPTLSPPATYGSLLVHDRLRGHDLLFGGWNGTSYSNQTWIWGGTTWALLSPPASPSARYFPGVVYDPASATILLFGGYDGTIHRNDTWRWDGITWTQLIAHGQPGSPPGRRGPGIAWDEHRGVAVMFGGFIQFSPSAIAFQDTWEWNGAWVQRAPATVPPIRAHCGMDFDSYRGRTVMYGGDAQGIYRTDTWEWDGTNWVQRTPPTTPPNSTGCALVFDPGSRHLLLHGGFDGTTTTNTTWRYATSQPASFTLLGTGCGPSWVLGLEVAEPDLPWAGSSAIVHVTQAPPGKLAVLVVGFDDQTSPFGPLPFSFAGLGGPGCSLYVNPQISLFLGLTPATWSTGPLPAAAIGQSLFVQAGVLEASANPLGIAMSPGGRLTLGAR